MGSGVLLLGGHLGVGAAAAPLGREDDVPPEPGLARAARARSRRARRRPRPTRAPRRAPPRRSGPRRACPAKPSSRRGSAAGPAASSSQRMSGPGKPPSAASSREVSSTSTGPPQPLVRPRRPCGGRRPATSSPWISARSSASAAQGEPRGSASASRCLWGLEVTKTRSGRAITPRVPGSSSVRTRYTGSLPCRPRSWMLPRCSVGKRCGDGALGRRADHDLAGLGHHLLEPRGHVDGVAEDRVVDAGGRADVADDDEAGVDGDADLDGRRGRPRSPLAVPGLAGGGAWRGPRAPPARRGRPAAAARRRTPSPRRR